MAISLSRLNKKRIGLLVIASFLLALSGLYGSFAYPFFVRWFYWATLVGIGIWLNDALSRQMDPILESRPWLVRWLVRSTALTIPLFAFVAVIESLAGNPVPASYYLDMAIKVWLVTAALTAFGMRDTNVETPQEQAFDEGLKLPGDSDRSIDPLPPGIPKVLERVQPALKNANLLALAAEDHYVRVITDAGEELILLRFSDAIDETTPIKGLQVHRSWWVAETAIETAKKGKSGPELRLKNNQIVPVSRRRLPAVKHIGWLPE